MRKDLVHFNSALSLLEENKRTFKKVTSLKNNFKRFKLLALLILTYLISIIATLVVSLHAKAPIIH